MPETTRGKVRKQQNDDGRKRGPFDDAVMPMATEYESKRKEYKSKTKR